MLIRHYPLPCSIFSQIDRHITEKNLTTKTKKLEKDITMRVSGHRIIALSLFILSLYCHYVQSRPFVLVLSNDDLTGGSDDNGSDESSDFDEFGESESKSEEELDPGSWRPIFEPNDSDIASPQHYSGLHKIISAASEGNTRLMEEAVAELELSASSGDPHAQSVMGFLYGIGMMRETSRSKSILNHHFAAEGGNMQSKMALAFRYLRQNVSNPNISIRTYRILQFIRVIEMFL